jgi:hypothetical protein
LLWRARRTAQGLSKRHTARLLEGLLQIQDCAMRLFVLLVSLFLAAATRAGATSVGALKVIGAGWGRTGTESTRLALELLGFGPVVHMHTLISSPADMLKWILIGEAKTKAERHALLKKTIDGNVQATMDFPASCYWEDLAELYPDAKILLTTRESADVWHESARNTILFFQDCDCLSARQRHRHDAEE